MNATTASTTNSTTKSYTVVPTIALYAGLASLFLGLAYSNGWLFALGLILVTPAVIAFLLPSLLLSINFWRMRQHPENYETVISEDEDGNITGINWKKIR